MSGPGRDPGLREPRADEHEPRTYITEVSVQTPVMEAFSGCTCACSSLNPRREPRSADEPRAPSGPPATEQGIAWTQHSGPSTRLARPKAPGSRSPAHGPGRLVTRLKQQADGQGAKVTPYQVERGGTWTLADPYPTAATASDSSSSTAPPAAATSARKKPRTRPAPHQHLTRRPTPDQKPTGDRAMTMSNEAEAG
jgi:hypothetical protein